MGKPNDGVSRRNVLLGTTAAASQILLSELVHAGAAPRSRSKVGIVGAGFGGLACAHELHAAGYRVEIFEARDRLGGRVRTARDFSPGNAVEEGAEFIGANHPLWLKYAKHFKLDLVSTDVPGDHLPKPIELDGQIIRDAKELERLEAEVERGHAEPARDSRAVNWEQPWETPKAAAYDTDSLAARIARLNISERAKRAIFIEFSNDMACDPRLMNYLALLCVIKAHGVEKYWSETEAFRCGGGNQTLARRFAEVIGAGQVHLSRPVSEIRARKETVTVKTADGRVEEYDDVVLAVPPSVWKHIRFDPPLPTEFSPQMGPAVKALARMRKRFWAQGQPVALMSDTFLGMTWEDTEREKAGQDVVLLSFVGGPAADRATR